MIISGFQFKLIQNNGQRGFFDNCDFHVLCGKCEKMPYIDIKRP